MTGPLVETFQNNAALKRDADIGLSVLIPFHNDDPRALMSALDCAGTAGIEIIVFDDGMPERSLCEAVRQHLGTLSCAATLIASKVNHGRSGARNRLAEAARAPWLLFLDADMAITPGFIDRWLEAAYTSKASVLFGGYEPGEPTAQTRVHAALAAASDGHDAARRNAIGAAAVCSSNLLMRAETARAIPFDEGYQGWGWEDVDWALSAAGKVGVVHIDNPAAHGGLESVDRLLAKFAQSGPNFVRLLSRHPEYANRPGAKLARLVYRLRAAWLVRWIGRTAARLPLPIRLRVLGMKLFRAAIAARAMVS